MPHKIKSMSGFPGQIHLRICRAGLGMHPWGVQIWLWTPSCVLAAVPLWRRRKGGWALQGHTWVGVDQANIDRAFPKMINYIFTH